MGVKKTDAPTHRRMPLNLSLVCICINYLGKRQVHNRAYLNMKAILFLNQIMVPAFVLTLQLYIHTQVLDKII